MRALAIAVATAIATLATGCAVKREKRDVGGDCYNDYSCKEGLRCYRKKCVTQADYDREMEREREQARRAQLAKEKKMLEASGVEPATVAESAPAAAAGTAVRVVEITERGKVLAACRDDERLVGGGCRGQEIVGNFPSAFGKADTVGAQWRCESYQAYNQVTAFALCQAVPGASKSAAADATDAGAQ